MTMKKPLTNADNCRKYRHSLAVEDLLLEQTRQKAREQSRWHRKTPTMEELLVVAILSFQALSFLLFCTNVPCGNEVLNKMHLKETKNKISEGIYSFAFCLIILIRSGNSDVFLLD